MSEEVRVEPPVPGTSPRATQLWADLHTHTTFSDGLLSPAEVICRAKAANLCAIAITDHDEVAAIEEALSAASTLSIEIVSGVELSVMHRGYDVHILGYFVDHRNPELIAFVQDFQHERWLRLDRILANLAAIGKPLPREMVLRKAGAGSVGRPHIADAMVEAGLADNYYDAFNRFLADGRPAYVPKKKLAVTDAIKLLHSAGGLAAIAHPGLDVPDEIILEIIRSGIDAIETVHPRHGDARRQHYTSLARTHGLLTTGGSDFHGGRKVNEKVGEFRVTYETVLKMKEYLNKVRATWV
jgi:predicted metal-dependent phosphoesterase TrpH